MSVFKNEAEGYAESLRQQASWIDGSVFTDDLDSDELRAAADFIERATPAWQPIATAPKDGAPVLIAERSDLTNGDHHWYIDTAVNCFELDIREVDVWKARESDETVCFAPTHWMPLPPPPEAQP